MALDLKELQSLIDTAKTADAFKADVRRALRKVSSAITTLQGAVDDAEALLSADYTPALKERKPRAPREASPVTEVDAEAPFGRKKDGTPKQRPGRVAKAE
jgi:hypothetical protein